MCPHSSKILSSPLNSYIFVTVFYNKLLKLYFMWIVIQQFLEVYPRKYCFYSSFHVSAICIMASNISCHSSKENVCHFINLILYLFLQYEIKRNVKLIVYLPGRKNWEIVHHLRGKILQCIEHLPGLRNLLSEECVFFDSEGTILLTNYHTSKHQYYVPN